MFYDISQFVRGLSGRGQDKWRRAQSWHRRATYVWETVLRGLDDAHIAELRKKLGDGAELHLDCLSGVSV